MAVVNELIRTEANGTLSFGNYELGEKSKLDNFNHEGDLYKVKTFKEITKLEKNGSFVYESVPGTTVTDLAMTEDGMTFTVEGAEDAQITVELADETDYDVIINGEDTGSIKTNLGGKLSLSVEFINGAAVKVEIKKA